ncbi:hypothetical protein FKG94_15600 [Exilibacterium tricleocarpae]|uniref:STAS/SEC14 domain-containing protein n=1 Tax=Exilibacterium tricleocarpae TaxID=2591008 RepID=A0A545TFM4_9GAMM|nr:hypothetical protein [Exilibacterium tricleocarpae]TQV76032.1 hypothetical protein FKG94_15600 [Exilibacterium tricleocarpae]
MAISYRYDTDKNMMWSSVTGTLTTEDIIAHIDRLFENNIRLQGLIEMIDMNRVGDVIIRHSDLFAIREKTAQLAQSGHKISIVFCSVPRGKEILQVMGPIFNQITVTVHICDTPEEALAYADALVYTRSDIDGSEKKGA